MHKLLLELFSEEIPASMQKPVASWLLKKVLADFETLIPEMDYYGKEFVSPRHMGFIISNIPDKIPPIHLEVKGPRITAPDGAINGFLRKYKINSIEELEKRGDFYYLVKDQSSPDIREEITKILQNALESTVWPKSMRWGEYKMKWVRPLHSMVCLLDDEILPINFGHLTAGRETSGHRFMGPPSVKIKDCDSYTAQMENSYVKIFPDERKEIIYNELQNIASNLNLKLRKDDNLLEEVAGLVEWPVVQMASIEEKFMKLPKEVLITSMRNHQKYFVFENQEGDIAPYFGLVLNIENNTQSIIKGNQKVLKARLSDAEFFFNEDRKKTLISRLDDLKKLTFHADVGSVYDKVMSMKKMAKKIALQTEVDLDLVTRAAELAKADLTTEMVKEFPELQGIMGYYYAIMDGEKSDIALSIREHYKPKGPNDDVPSSPLSITIALAEKLDTLNHMFANNIKPTGSKDPYALRRAALGVLRIMECNSIQLDMNSLNVRDDVKDFIKSKEAKA